MRGFTDPNRDERTSLFGEVGACAIVIPMGRDIVMSQSTSSISAQFLDRAGPPASGGGPKLAGLSCRHAKKRTVSEN
ncbi:hypothetical protein EV129_12153 [Rhizobium azibense]|uniref:Uncharacterized protein n=1 Tax=Rhizobium azibense TaxID=1136135 RepID=A0A4R3RCQ9_9HYPH|nr:hypothetical protein EV129_12153 [Rhizobium azibense]